MKKKKISALAFGMLTVMSFCGCDESTTSTQIIGGGSCLFVNHNTKDSVVVMGITIGDLDNIKVHNGDLLEMTFIPDSKYEKYRFTVTYTLMDGTRHSCTNYDYTYKFIVSDWGAKDGTFFFNAKYNDKNTNITSGGAIDVVLVDND